MPRPRRRWRRNTECIRDGEIGRLHGAAARREITRRRAHDDARRADAFRDEGTIGEAADAYGQIVAFLDEIDEPVVQNEINIHARIARGVGRDPGATCNAPKDIGAVTRNRPTGSDAWAAISRSASSIAARMSRHRSRIGGPLLRQANLARGAVEQSQPKMGLEVHHKLAGHRSRQAEPSDTIAK